MGEEGLRAEHQGSPLASKPFGDALQLQGHVFGVMPGSCSNPAALECIGMSRLIVFRGNKAMSNGGFTIGASSDVLLEGNEVRDTPSGSISGTEPYTLDPH